MEPVNPRQYPTCNDGQYWLSLYVNAAREVVELTRIVGAMADRIYAAHEVLGRLAERRAVVLSERTGGEGAYP